MDLRTISSQLQISAPAKKQSFHERKSTTGDKHISGSYRGSEGDKVIEVQVHITSPGPAKRKKEN